MRKLVRCGLVACFSSSATVAAAEESAKVETNVKEEEDDTPSVGVLIEPLLAFVGFYEGEVDITVDDDIAFALWGQYFDYTLLDTGISGYGVGVGAPIFLTREVHRGVYVFPLIRFQGVDFHYDGATEASAVYYGPLLTVGYQWRFANVLTLRLGGGIEYSWGSVSTGQMTQDVSLEGLGGELDASLGIVF